MLADSIVHEYDQIPNLKFGDKYFLGIAQVVKMKIKPLLNSWFNGGGKMEDGPMCDFVI